MKPIPLQWIVFLCFVSLGLLSGCATTPPQEFSDQPWNQPQSWEGVIAIPGMDGRN